MYSFTIRVAGFVIGVSTIHVRPYADCRAFLTDSADVDISITSSQHDIDSARLAYHDSGMDRVPWDGVLEVAVVFKKLADAFVERNILVLHGSVVAINNEAYLFSAPSGTGKTTHVKQWLKRCPDAFVVNGDKPFIKFTDEGLPIVCGSPWAGKEGMYANTMVPLKAIVVMHRSDENHMRQISFSEAFPSLLEQVYRPEDESKMRKTIHLLLQLSSFVAFWRFDFNNYADDCFQIAYDALSPSI